MSDEQEIARIRSEEIARGKQSAGRLARRRKKLEGMLLRALLRGDRELYAEGLSELGQLPGTAEYENSIRIFDEYHAGR